MTVGVEVAAGRVTVEPELETGGVGGDDALAVPAALCAVTATVSACPTSSVTGRYVSVVAPTIGTQPAPAASQRCH